MPNKPPKEPEGPPPTSPSRFAETPPPHTYPSGDYTYTLEVVMGMQKALGELTQAVKTLTDQVKDQGTKIDGSCKDIHAAKVVIGVLGTLGVGALAFFGFLAKAALDYFSKVPAR